MAGLPTARTSFIGRDRAALEESLAGWEHSEVRFERACTRALLEDRPRRGAPSGLVLS